MIIRKREALEKLGIDIPDLASDTTTITINNISKGDSIYGEQKKEIHKEKSEIKR